VIDEGDESFELRGLVGADQDLRLAGMGKECGVELIIGE
jgi:hypothetical protein